MNRVALALAIVCCTAGCKVSGLKGTCSRDSDCGPGLTCNSSVDPHVCVSACDPVCGTNETCANARCVTTGPTIQAVRVTDNPTGPNGFYQRSAAISIPVSVDVVPGFGGQIASVFLTVSGSQINPGPNPITTGTTTTYSFTVPTTAVPDGSDGPFSFQVTATDATGHVATVTPTNGLKVDAAGPIVRTVAVDSAISPPDATVGSNAWFRQSGAGDIDVKATIVDLGTGVDPATLMLVQGATRIDRVGLVTRDPGTDNYHFKVLRSGVPVPGGAQALVAFRVAAADVLKQPRQPDSGTNVGSGSVGIDGAAPSMTFTPSYPIAGTGCDPGVAVCGHDGSHLWRIGDDGTTLLFTADDRTSGSGADASAGATCAIPGNPGCAVNPGVATAGTALSYSFAIDPSVVLLTSTGSAAGPNPTNTDDNGEGTVAVSVTARDRVGNQATAVVVPVKVTRVKWVRRFTTIAGFSKGSPIFTPPIGGSQLILVGGTNTGGDPIVSLDTTGRVVGTTGSTQPTGVPAITTVTSNMAYSPVTGRLFIIQQAGSTAYAYSVSATGFSAAFACGLLGQTNGAPAIVGTTAANERMLVGDSGNNRLWAVAGTGTACLPNTTSVSLGAPPGPVGTPTTNGTSVYVPYGDTGIGRATYNLTTGLGDLVQQNLTQSVVGSVALAGNLFYGEFRTYHSLSANLPTGSQLWTAANAGVMVVGTITSPPVVFDSLVFGTATAADGHLRAFDSGTGVDTIDYPSAGTTGAPSQVAIGADKLLYFSDSQNQLTAVRYAKVPASATQVWRFRGTSVGSGAVNVSFVGPGSQATLDSTGVLYFGADNGNIYALMTDSGGSATPVGGTNWPRTGFDNCNSGNSSYANCR